MIKRIRIWVKELNLSQQLLTIVFLTVSVFALFFFVYLSDNINSFVDSEMYRILHRTQASLVNYYESDGDVEELEDYSDSIITHLLIDKEQLYSENLVKIDVIGPSFYDDKTIQKIAKETINNKLGDVDKVYSNKEQRILYSISEMSDRYICVSLLNDTYRSEFKNALLNSVINLAFIVVGVLFVTLMLWVGSLIHPINQIKNYIEKIRNGQIADLKIDRRDEIGELALAIIEMQQELKHQVSVKDEMIQNISHDLKTPISTIKSYAESIKDGIYPYDSLDKSVDVIIEHATRLEKKVYSLLMLNKMGYLEDIAPVGNTLNMNVIINKVILSMEVVRQDLNITPFLQPVFFHGEEEPWRICIENILENSLRYAQSEIVITSNQNSIQISNDGPLMSEERISKLFRPYEKGTDGQFGLGLSIVYRVCSTYGYKVEAENMDNGVLFTISQNK